METTRSRPRSRARSARASHSRQVAEEEQPKRITGEPAVWARDFAVFGALNSGLALLPMWFSGPQVPILAMLVGGLTGAMLGSVMPAALDRMRGRMPLWRIGARMVMVGLMWGALTMAAASALAISAAGITSFPWFLAFPCALAALWGAAQQGRVLVP
jgi:hypothetical protein